jgi:hypothetical protein
MKHTLSGPGALLGAAALVLVLLAVRQTGLTNALGGLVQLSGGVASTGGARVGPSRGERLAQQVAGSRTAEERRTVWVPTSTTMRLDYRVTVERGRLRLAVEEVGVAGRTLWSTSLESGRSENVSIPVRGGRNVEVVARLSGFGGAYEVSWTVDGRR